MTDINKVDAENANPQAETTVKPDSNVAEEPDYKVKFSESSKEALRLLEENKAKEAALAEKERMIEELRQQAERATTYGEQSGVDYPGFENLGDEEKKNLIAYTNSIKSGVLNEIMKDPSIAHAKHSYNERMWDSALQEVVNEFPDLRESQSDFKAKYFKPDNVPSNIKDILKDLAKIHLFDKAKDLGAKQALEQEATRIDVERAKGGEISQPSSRSLEDWHRLASTNPREFARRSKEFNEDMASGKLK